MALAENGDQPRRNLLEFARDIRNSTVKFIKQNPMPIFLAVFPSLFVGVTSIGYTVFFMPQDIAEKQKRDEISATATTVAQDKIRKDYLETGGLNILRLQKSFVFTPRESARLAASDEELRDNAWLLAEEQGCQVLETFNTGPRTFQLRVSCQNPQ